jgi:Flp pilus assembly protein TadG
MIAPYPLPVGQPVGLLRRFLRRLRDDRRGLAMVEFAYAAPLVIAAGGWGAELANLAITNLRVSQYALNLADNASRIGQFVSGGASRLRESDLTDVLQATRLESDGLKLTSNGRVTLSSLENVQQTGDTAAVQRIHWQRCIGMRTEAGYRSNYGISATSATGTYAPGGTYDPAAGVNTATNGTDNSAARPGSLAPNGMGPATAQVMAPEGSGVMFVEINYEYQPLFGNLFMAPQRIQYIASYVVRDNRDYGQVYDSKPATRSTCDKATD